MRAAIIPTHSRPTDFADCVDAISPQVGIVIAVAHGTLARRYANSHTSVDYVIPYDHALPNISTMWRLGLDVARAAGATWAAVLNDDAIVPSNWFSTLRTETIATHAAGASGYRAPGVKKIAGYAFILDLTSGVQPDERMRWWYSDDAIERRCESHSWFALCPNVQVEHRHPNKTTVGDLRRISRADKREFQRRYP